MTELKKQIMESKTAYTHAGIFHADDLLAAALVKIINPNIKIKRTFSPEEHPDEFMFDIGGGKYDHHDGIKKRENSIPYAAFGLLFRDLYPEFMTEKQYLLFDDAFIKEIDNCDNTSNINPLSSALALLNPVWNSDIQSDKTFEDSVDLIIPLLKNIISYFKKDTVIFGYYMKYDEIVEKILRQLPKEFRRCFAEHDFGGYVYEPVILDNFLIKTRAAYGKRKTSPLHILMKASSDTDVFLFLKKIIYQKIRNINAIPDAYDECDAAYSGGEILILKRYVPYEYFAAERDIKYILFPSDRNGYNICCAQMTKDEKQKSGIDKKTRAYRKLFPEELRGKTSDELSKKYKGLTFVHASGFMANCKTKEDAIHFILEQGEK